MIVETLGVMGVTVVVLDLVERETQWGAFYGPSSRLGGDQAELTPIFLMLDDVYYFKCDLADPKAIGATLAAVREEVRPSRRLVWLRLSLTRTSSSYSRLGSPQSLSTTLASCKGSFSPS